MGVDWQERDSRCCLEVLTMHQAVNAHGSVVGSAIPVLQMRRLRLGEGTQLAQMRETANVTPVSTPPPAP